jgi:GT2 family glycosyltransferase
MSQSYDSREYPRTISIIIPTYMREKILVDTVNLLFPLLQPGDEIVIIDQSPRHEPSTEEALSAMAAADQIRWYRRARPHICAAMNAGATLARSAILLFVDDDVIPSADLLEAHRRDQGRPDAPPATCGQVLQPWHPQPLEKVADFGLEFDFAYNNPCEILTLIGCNFSVRRDTFLRVGGFDESFSEVCYRFEAEFCYRLFHQFGKKVHFLPSASLRHLKSSGGTRAFGEKDTWRHIGGSIGDYYFALRCLSPGQSLVHCFNRMINAPINRNTLLHPWLIPSLFVREVVAWCRAAGQVWAKPRELMKEAAYYNVSQPPGAVAV